MALGDRLCSKGTSSQGLAFQNRIYKEQRTQGRTDQQAGTRSHGCGNFEPGINRNQGATDWLASHRFNSSGIRKLRMAVVINTMYEQDVHARDWQLC